MNHVSTKRGLDFRGMTLVEVVIACAIMAVVGLGMSSMIVQSLQGAQSVQRRLSSTELQSFINLSVNNSTLCTKLFANKPPPAVNVSVPTIDFAGTLIDDGANNLFENGNIKVQSLKYKSVAVSGSLYTAVIELVVNTQGANSNQQIVGGNQLKPIDFPFVAAVTAGKIVSCGGSGEPQIRYGNAYASGDTFIPFSSPFTTVCTSATASIADPSYNGLHGVNITSCNANGFYARVRNADGSSVSNWISYQATGF